MGYAYKKLREKLRENREENRKGEQWSVRTHEGAVVAIWQWSKYDSRVPDNMPYKGIPLLYIHRAYQAMPAFTRPHHMETC